MELYGGNQSAATDGPSVNENLDVHSVSYEPDPLPKLFPIATSLDDIGNTQMLSSTASSSLIDLGYVSPCKASPVVSKGYFLRSCSKSVQETSRFVKDKLGSQKVVSDAGLEV